MQSLTAEPIAQPAEAQLLAGRKRLFLLVDGNPSLLRPTHRVALVVQCVLPLPVPTHCRCFKAAHRAPIFCSDNSLHHFKDLHTVVTDEESYAKTLIASSREEKNNCVQ